MSDDGWGDSPRTQGIQTGAGYDFGRGKFTRKENSNNHKVDWAEWSEESEPRNGRVQGWGGRGSGRDGYRNFNNNDDDGWGDDENRHTDRISTRGGRGRGSYRGGRGGDRNGHRNFDNNDISEWGDDENRHTDRRSERGGRGRGRGSYRGGRGGERDGHRHFYNNEHNEWGDDEKGHAGRSERGGRGRCRGSNRGDHDGYRGSRGSYRGGHRNLDNKDNNGWGDNENGYTDRRSDGEERGRGRGSNRGGRGGYRDGHRHFDNNGWGDDDNGRIDRRSDRDDRHRGRGSNKGGRGGCRDGHRNFDNNVNNGWGDGEKRYFDRRSDREDRGRSSNRGGGGDRDGRRNFNNNDNNEWGDGNGYRGGDGSWGGKDQEGGGDQSEKAREKYIPPDPTEDESEIFNNGNATGLNFDKYDNIQVNVSGDNILRPISTFEDSGLRQYLLENVKKSGYTKPTPIQKYAIPHIMEGRDIMACAQTGSGKTAAFLLPILHKLLAERTDLIVDDFHCEPQVVIVSPTRELAIQIHDECRKLSHGSILKTTVAYGGTAIFHQIKQLQKGCHVLVATPGRLMDFTRQLRISFQSIRFVVLDEADRMLDMGFLPEMRKLLTHKTMVETGKRQTLMFSATFPDEIQRLAGEFLRDYIFITVGIMGSACQDIEQKFYQVSKFEKRNKLNEVFNVDGSDRTLVFVETKRTADYLARFLCQTERRKATSIHGDRSQREREIALSDFKRGRCDILVATAVAARGLDIKNVKHVINYDLPKKIDEYVHRIGRTGRVGNGGKATSFYDSDTDTVLDRDLVRILEQAGQSIPDWLKSYQSDRSGGIRYSKNRFGGEDYRSENIPSQPADEEW